MKLMDKSGRVAVITGGGRGIGYAAGRLLAAEGVKLALADINADAVTAAAKRLAGETGASVIGVPTDITKPDSVAALFERVTKEIGPVDILINSAAIVDDKTFLESSEADWRRMIEICLYGPMHCLKAVLPGMVERKFGRIVCMASDSARMGQARLSYYAAAKAGVVALVKSVAQEVGRANVTLNIVSPGATNTELRKEREASLLAQMGPEKYARRQQSVLKLYPTGRLGEPDDIAATIAFLVSDRASWMTGQIVSVNGGFAMP